MDSYTFGPLVTALTNRSYGMESEAEMINESTKTIINYTDYFEIIKFSSPKHIFFENSDKIVIHTYWDSGKGIIKKGQAKKENTGQATKVLVLYFLCIKLSLCYLELNIS